MIFAPKQAQAIAQGRKTTMRLPTVDPAVRRRSRKVGAEVRYYGPEQLTQPWTPSTGQVIGVQERARQTPICHVECAGVDRAPLGEPGRRIACDEGFGGLRGPLELRRQWLKTYDRAWLVLATHPEDGISDDAIVARFSEQHADTEVWIVTFALCEEPNRYLAKGSSDYTHSAGLSFDDLPAIDAATTERYAKQAEADGIERRASLKADLDRAREQARAERQARRIAHLRRSA